MTPVYVILGVLAVCALIIGAIWIHDMIWIKKNPKAHAELGETDIELCRQEGRYP